MIKAIIKRSMLAVCAVCAAACSAVQDEPSLSQDAFTDCEDVCPEMVIIPAGSFIMGSDQGEEGRPEWPEHEVTIARPFALARFEITAAQFLQFVEDTDYQISKNCRSFDPATIAVNNYADADFLNPGYGGSDGSFQTPAGCISWTDAQAYIQWLSNRSGQGYRLPSEAEWEYAARAGSQAQYPWGDDASKACDYANALDADGLAQLFANYGGDDTRNPEAPPLDSFNCSDGHVGAAPVGSFQPNGFGLHDMIGNVWEWTQDCYVAPYPDDVPLDGSAYENAANCDRRSVRGGSWISVPFRNRSSWRGRDPENLVTWIFGLRVARDLSAEEIAQLP